MSRCYAFPPPGFEKKHLIDDIAQLSKEKRKEKKHRKDRGSEEKDGKVKKEKDGSNKKRKEKKDHKEKHKRKRDRTENGSEIEKSCGTGNDNRKPKVQLNGDGGRVNSNVVQTKCHSSESPSHAEELSRRIRAEGEATGSRIGKVTGIVDSNRFRMVEKEESVRLDHNNRGTSKQIDNRTVNGSKDSCHLSIMARGMVNKEENELRGQIVQKIRLTDLTNAQVCTRTDDRNVEQNKIVKGSKGDGRVISGAMDSNLLLSSLKRAVDKEKNGLGGQIVQKIIVMDQTKAQMHTKIDNRNGCLILEPKGTMGCNHLQVSAKRVTEKEKNGLVGQVVQKLVSMDQAKVQIHTKNDGRNGCISLESNGKEKGTQVYTRMDTIHGEAMNVKNVVQRSEGEDTIRDREKKEDEVANGQFKAASKGRTEQNNSCYDKPFDVSAASGRIQNAKRKEIEIIDNESRPQKLQRPLTALKTFETCEKGNGFMLKSSLLSAVEASMRPPHPDSVLLDQILYLPKVDRTQHFDDQEWLFSNTKHQKSPKIHDSVRSDGQMVWNYGREIESADVFALPYVIPY